ncbi:LysR family transcriptional regulator [Ancylobacter sp. Lp-2]|uniref:LysR family transcriptional regulator n=1 Tax=Ancylobacter sp. Lp-2 TaxID=2881339 RepID=UPI001E3CAF16|nr:LysR family transcriptional regulator [Ancylobacter sp. Lp-2]MCB4770360.1 LysR family transcriptional regulator [Ancylobacter sp. Lp-2]
MRPSLAQLEAFYWTAELGSAQRAARHLNIAQPTISLRLKELGEHLGLALLERSGRELRVTPEGRALLPRVANILAELRGIVSHDPTRQLVGPIRIGLAEGFAVNCLAPLLAALLDSHPGLQPEWFVSTSTTLEAQLRGDVLDVGVLLNPVGDERLTMVALGSQPTAWAVPSAWGLDGPLAPQDIWSLPIISNPPPSAMHRQVTAWFAAAGLSPSRLSVCSSVAVIAELVAEGIGMSVLPERMVTRLVTDGLIQLVATNPPIEDGRLFVVSRNGGDDAKFQLIVSIIKKVLHNIKYLRD